VPSLHPDPGFDYYYKACKKGDPEAKAVTVDQSPVAALANASEITELPRDNFEVYEISKDGVGKSTILVFDPKPVARFGLVWRLHFKGGLVV
jgi:hypothetical protein